VGVGPLLRRPAAAVAAGGQRQLVHPRREIASQITKLKLTTAPGGWGGGREVVSVTNLSVMLTKFGL
jgi:hypothetical protein